VRAAITTFVCLAYLAVLPASAMSCAQLARHSWQTLMESESFDVRRVACKPMPDMPKKAIVVVDGKPAIVDISSGRILSKGPDIGMSPDQRVEIDTARYWIRPGSRAFGLVFSNSVPHKHFEEFVRQLTLFEIHGSRIDPVLEEIVVAESANGIGDDCKDKTQEAFNTCDMHDSHSTLTMLKSANKGYYDIEVDEESRDCEGDTVEQCQAKNGWRQPSLTRYMLRFDGTRYERVGDSMATQSN
jgi:hypothetical protein